VPDVPECLRLIYTRLSDVHAGAECGDDCGAGKAKPKHVTFAIHSHLLPLTTILFCQMKTIRPNIPPNDIPDASRRLCHMLDKQKQDGRQSCTRNVTLGHPVCFPSKNMAPDHQEHDDLSQDPSSHRQMPRTVTTSEHSSQTISPNALASKLRPRPHHWPEARH
jgi:hypothetical protein